MLYEVGIDLIKSFPVSHSFFPFVKSGLGISLIPGSLADMGEPALDAKLGAGIIFKASESIELLGGLDYVLRKWKDQERVETLFGSNKGSLQAYDTSLRYYVGINYLF